MIYDPYVTLFTKINFKWIIDLNGKATTVKFLRENVDDLFCLGVGTDFSARTQIVQPRKGNIDQLDFVEMENSQSAEETLKNIVESPATDLEKVPSARIYTRQRS